MKQDKNIAQPNTQGFAARDILRGFFRVLTMFAGALIVAYLVFSFLNQTGAPASPELTEASMESGIFLSYTRENGLECTFLCSEAHAKVSAALLVEGGGLSYISEPFAEIKKAEAGSKTVLSLDPSSLKYKPSGNASGTPVSATELLLLLPEDATAKVVLSADGESFLTGTAFCPLPFLYGGAYGA